jgi:hypothetical protein
MGRHERVNPREGGEMIAYLKTRSEISADSCLAGVEHRRFLMGEIPTAVRPRSS